MKKLSALLTIVTIVMVCGCGGGSGGSTTGNAPQTIPTPPVTAPTTVTNPLTGTAAPGNPTTTLYGIAYAGASVTAYNVQSDGSSGSVIAGPVTSTVDGFTLTFTSAPTGWVRLVATGGTKTRTVDNTVQPGGTMQLVTPFITTSQNNLKITPLTDIAANVMAANAKKGASLADAFSAGMHSMLELDIANILMISMSDTTVYLNALKGAIKSDKTYYDAQSPQSAELLMGLDNLGVLLDMPTKDVTRIVGQSAQSGYLLSGIDGTGKDINAGAWVGTTFDPAAPQTLKALMNDKVLDSEKVTNTASGTKVAPRVVDFVSKYMVMDVMLDNACHGGGVLAFTSRYPFYALNSQGGIQQADCIASAARMADLRARVDTNKSSGMK